ncbi:MAG TPA: hypothetical protein VF167_01125 [Longimicrobiaceae bacterium]
MAPPETVRLQLQDGPPLAVQIRKETSVRSLHTGRSLQELHGWVVTADAALHQRLATLLPTIGERPLRSEDEQGEFTGRWCVSWNSYGESAGVHTYTLILREAEELSLRSLILDDLELHPYEYREEASATGLRIRAKLVGTEQDVLDLRRKAMEQGTFAVVRQGIQDEPRRMRLEVEEWSPFEDRVKYRISLSDPGLEVADEEPETDADSSRAPLVFYANFLEQLAEMLVRKQLISREELRSLREAARRDPGLTRHELWKVADVDQL